MGAVFASQFKVGEEAIESIATESEFNVSADFYEGGSVYRLDRVQHDGKDIGMSSGRIDSCNYRSMISLRFIDPAYAEEGTELTLIWGTPSTRQMPIRVTVKQMPYNQDLTSNQKKDVEEIPRRFVKE